jgi:predicted Rossmann fold nucleotide-binding protein DprA/Smf involved in DNA uptake
MTISKRDLQAVRKDIKALEKKMTNLLNSYGKAQKLKTAKRTRRKALKTKTRFSRASQKTAFRKKAPKMTATEHILKIVGRSRKGVDVPTLKVKTGFEDKKVRNIIFRASKEGKIKKVGRGIYVGAKK